MVIIYQPKMNDEECASILGEIGIFPGEKRWSRFVSQVHDTFSYEQTASLVDYLNSRQGTSAYQREAVLPKPEIVGASAIPTMPSFRDGLVYRFYTERGYALPFKVEAINLKTYLYMTHLFNEFDSVLVSK